MYELAIRKLVASNLATRVASKATVVDQMSVIAVHDTLCGDALFGTLLRFGENVERRGADRGVRDEIGQDFSPVRAPP